MADYVARQLDPLIAKQGFSETSLLTRWREIVGPRIAEICEPMRLQWPPRARVKVEGKERVSEPATLILRVEPGFGLEAQHLTPAIIDRVNAHLGWRCVSRAVLRQEPLLGGGGRTKDKTRPLPPRDPAARARAEAATEGVATQSLRAALTALGENALAPGPFGKSGESK
ncbi:MAG: DciA family protein [Methylocystis sp.]|nr:DciA family protein [Methylocystis sp.]